MSFHQFKAKTLEGKEIDFSQFKGKKILVLNTASACGLTPQYGPLQELYTKYKDQNFTILGFPSNDFMGQEPGSDGEIAQFCESQYGVNFPLFSKRHVIGENRDEIFAWLSDQPNSSEPKWNFHKYLIDENGNFVKQLAPTTSPLDEEILNWIEGNE